jgi:sigma-B regulation protein RsbU (phosphoserine phosphatase)
VLRFLFEMSQTVGNLLDEQKISEFVVNKGAQLLACMRASLMLYDPESGMLKIRASIGVPQEMVSTAAVRPGERISGKVFQSGRQVVVGTQDEMPAESIGLRELGGAPCFLSVPLMIPVEGRPEQEILGVLNFTGKLGGQAFTGDDLMLVHTLAAFTAAQVHNCRLIAAEQERRRLEQELALAADIQLRLLPEKPLSAGSVRVAGICRPARRVGGDFFDYWENSGIVHMLVADVAGHDLGAALLTTALRSIVRTEAAHRQSVRELVEQVNRNIYADLLRSELLISMCYMEVACRDGKLTFCRCGHPHPLLLRGREHMWLETGGPMLGIQEDAVFDEASLQLVEGDLLLLYTDGLLEAHSPDGRQFGKDGLLKALREVSNEDVHSLLELIVKAVQQHMDGAEQDDDVTILGAKSVGPQGA